jgi:uncharacterized protein YecT (DUF1311 family)
MKYLLFYAWILIFLSSCDKKATVLEKVIHDTVFVEKVSIESDPYSSPYNCGDSISQYSMNICSKKEYMYFDSIMLHKYDSLLLSLEPDFDDDIAQRKYLSDLKSELYNSQKEWKEYMLSNAAYVAREYEGGSIRSMMISMQQTSDTKARIIVLDNLDGDQ